MGEERSLADLMPTARVLSPYDARGAEFTFVDGESYQEPIRVGDVEWRPNVLLLVPPDERALPGTVADLAEHFDREEATELLVPNCRFEQRWEAVKRQIDVVFCVDVPTHDGDVGIAPPDDAPSPFEKPTFGGDVGLELPVDAPAPSSRGPGLRKALADCWPVRMTVTVDVTCSNSCSSPNAVQCYFWFANNQYWTTQPDEPYDTIAWYQCGISPCA